MFQVTILVFLFTSRQHAVGHPLPERILWIGAHPDDEAYVAPLLGRACVEGTDRCSFLVMTRGEGGGDPVVRSGEIRRAADFFNAHLDLWTLSDVGAIDAERPSIIYTFDPSHGSTCHPAHRAVGAMVIEAVA